MIFTTNKPLAAWGKVLHDPDLAKPSSIVSSREAGSTNSAETRIGRVTCEWSFNTGAQEARGARFPETGARIPEPTVVRSRGWSSTLV
jgi:hypothetical protein